MCPFQVVKTQLSILQIGYVLQIRRLAYRIEYSTYQTVLSRLHNRLAPFRGRRPRFCSLLPTLLVGINNNCILGEVAYNSISFRAIIRAASSCPRVGGLNDP